MRETLCRIGLYDPLDDTAEVEYLDTLTEMEAFYAVRRYNQRAENDPVMKRSLGVFPLPQLCADVSDRQPDVVSQRRGYIRVA